MDVKEWSVIVKEFSVNECQEVVKGWSGCGESIVKDFKY